VTEENSKVPESDRPQENPPTTSIKYDKYRSVADSKLLIFVEKDVVLPFRFKAGGWELLESSIELGWAVKARISQGGFFMFRVNEDQTDGIELIDVPSRSQKGTEIVSE